GNVLKIAAVVACRLYADAAQLGCQIHGGQQFVVGAAATALKGIAGEELEVPADAIGHGLVLAVFSRKRQGQTENAGTKQLPWFEHIPSRISSLRETARIAKIARISNPSSGDCWRSPEMEAWPTCQDANDQIPRSEQLSRQGWGCY